MIFFFSLFFCRLKESSRDFNISIVNSCMKAKHEYLYDAIKIYWSLRERLLLPSYAD